MIHRENKKTGPPFLSQDETEQRGARQEPSQAEALGGRRWGCGGREGPAGAEDQETEPQSRGLCRKAPREASR